jgi:YHS domain-containing protein
MTARCVLGLLLATVAGCSCGAAQGPAAAYDLDGDCVAMQGYDPVAFHTEQEARAGKETISRVHKGATYLFVSEENKALFAKEPERYMAAYGGWCAYAVAGDGTAKTGSIPITIPVPI